MNKMRVFGRISNYFLSSRSLVFQRIKRLRNLYIVSRKPLFLNYSENVPFFPKKGEIFRQARECFSQNGYYPISFSWPLKFYESSISKSDAISSTVPYFPYSFFDAEAYYKSYSSSVLAITQKKGGWDCFRHLEIISRGCTPLFLNASRIPKYTMIHYPKDYFVLVNESYRRTKLLPGPSAVRNLVHFANENLTSSAMCRYFSEISAFDVDPKDTILFVDSRLSTEPDYLSLFTFIGLKQIYGGQIESLYTEPDYVYVDSTQDVSQLYGRGFGYSRVLDRSLPSSRPGGLPKIIIVSNLERDFSLLVGLKLEYPLSRFVMFWGSDTTIPDSLKKDALQITQGQLYCREIY